jgi:NAD(P)-dependent dehydrogenase (short-subunit alcohol dehydrogenase family)
VRRRADRRPFKEGAEETARLLSERGAEPVVIQADVARPEDISRMFAEARRSSAPRSACCVFDIYPDRL